MNQLPIPSHYDPNNAARWDYAPDQALLFEQAQAWARVHNLKAAGADRRKLHLLLIDLQKDFCYPEGSLYVAGRSGTGAIDDNRRIAEFIYRNLHLISATTVTMDSHYPFQIFFSSFWRYADGRPVPANTLLPAEDVLDEKVVPNRSMAAWISQGNYGWLHSQVKHYAAELQREGRYQLFLWPYHCLLGSDGHPLAGIIHEARLFHSFAREAQAYVEVKGGNWLSENYSVLRPEVLTTYQREALGQKNAKFLEKLLVSNAVIVAGQAASHCVKSTIEDLLAEIVAQDPGLAQKVYILADCMSAVVIRQPDGTVVLDFTPEAEAALDRFTGAGMNVVRSTDPIETWPGIRL